MSRKFELWLDESGDFDKDSKKKKRGWNPSLIGGVLVEKDAFGIKAIEKVIPEDSSHSTEESREATFARFQRIEKKAGEITKEGKLFRYVVFPNSECIMVLDNNLTYQNIMAEGIMKLMVWLKNYAGEDIHLHILIARRRDTTADSVEMMFVEKPEYEVRIKEKIMMSGIRHKVRENEWTVEIGSARKEKKLMVADVICNCFLTRETKFQGIESEAICSVYEDSDKTVVFSVLQDSFERQFQELLLSGRFGEAVTVICQCDHTDIISKCMDTAREYVNKTMKKGEMALHCHFIDSLLDYYMNVQNSYDLCVKMITRILEYLIPILEESGQAEYRQIANRMVFDLNFYLLTVYSHQGIVKNTHLLEEKCEKAFQLLPAGWDVIMLDIKYKIRKIVTRMNCFDFGNALELNDSVIQECRDIKESLQICRGDAKYEELGKALGTKVQLYTFLLRGRKEYYGQAAEASDEAIEEFVSDADKHRQYIYRVNLEIEAQQYEKAFQYLCKVYGLNEQGRTEEFQKALKNNKDLFALYAFIKLMAHGRADGWEKAKELYHTLQKTGVMKDLQDKKEAVYPDGIIWWKYAAYLAGNQEWKAACMAYENAAWCCFREDEFTINLIGLAVELERYAFALKEGRDESRKYAKSLKKRYQMIMQKELPDSMRMVFGEIDFTNTGWEYYYNLSRKVTY